MKTNTILIIFAIIIILGSIPWIICGILSSKLHEIKGYKGGFWLGFLFGLLGFIFSMVLPDRVDKIIIKNNNTAIIKSAESRDNSVAKTELRKRWK